LLATAMGGLPRWSASSFGVSPMLGFGPTWLSTVWGGRGAANAVRAPALAPAALGRATSSSESFFFTAHNGGPWFGAEGCWPQRRFSGGPGASTAAPEARSGRLAGGGTSAAEAAPTKDGGRPSDTGGGAALGECGGAAVPSGIASGGAEAGACWVCGKLSSFTVPNFTSFIAVVPA